MGESPPPVPLKSIRRRQITPPTPPPLKDLPALPNEHRARPSIDDIQRQITRASDEVLQSGWPRPDSPTRPELKSVSYGQSRPPVTTAQDKKGREKRLSELTKHIGLARRKSSIASQDSFGSANRRALPPRATIHDNAYLPVPTSPMDASTTTPVSVKSHLSGPSGTASAEEMQVVLKSINSAREQHGIPPLALSSALCGSAARFAQHCAEQNKPTDRIVNFVFQVRHMAYPGDGTRLESVEVPAGDEDAAMLKVTRLVSAPLGALAVAERWISGKYKQHLTPVDPRVHLKYCQCLEFEAWKVIMNARYRKLGLARDEHGQWIAEFLVEEHHGKAIPLATRFSSDTLF